MPNRPPEFIRLLAAAVDAKAGYFPGHSDGVAFLVRMMAAEAGWNRDDVDALTTAALLHDIGKIMVPDELLRAERRLTDQEFEQMKMHSSVGAHIVSNIVGCEFAVPWVLHHHEHFDGSGYPAGLRASEIPIASRILLVADAFHVMTSDRPYQRARTRGQALHEIERLSGVQFCPMAAQLLIARRPMIDPKHYILQGPRPQNPSGTKPPPEEGGSWSGS